MSLDRTDVDTTNFPPDNVANPPDDAAPLPSAAPPESTAPNDDTTDCTRAGNRGTNTTSPCATVEPAVATTVNHTRYAVSRAAVASSTADWTLGSARWDIKFAYGTTVFYSETMRLNIIDQVTD